MSRRLVIASLFLILAASVAPLVVDAQSTSGLAAERLRILPACASSGNCGFNDFVQLFANLAKWGFAMLAVVALIYMIWGGGWLLIAGGRREYISRGKEVIKGAFLGSLMVLLAIVVVNFIGNAIGNRTGNLVNVTAGCRQNNSGSCQEPSAVLRNGCFDPRTSNGRVVNLQELLLTKCPEATNLEIDGCFGPITAFWLYNFKISNNLTDIPSDYRQTQATPNDIALLLSPDSRGCTLAIEEPEPDVNPGDPSLPPIDQQAGCCVPNRDSNACIDVSSSFDCPFEPALEPNQPPLYSFQPTSCDNLPTCRPQCCARPGSGGTFACTRITQPSECLNGIPLNGTCEAQGGLCTTIN